MLTDPAEGHLTLPAPSLSHMPDGDGHFFFLAPLGEGGENGDFNPALLTQVRICVWSRAADTDGNPLTDPCTAVLTSFASDDIHINANDESYRVNWSVRNTNGIQLGDLYAIQVLASGVPIGSAEVVVGRNAKQAKDFANALGGGVTPLVRNQTVPVRYRIENGLFCEGDCYEATVTQEGGDFTTPDGEAGVSIGPNALPPGTDDVTLIIEEVSLDPGEECLGNLAMLATTGKCIRFDTEPKLVKGFAEDVVVGICLDPSGVPAGVDPENFTIHRFDPDNPAGPVEELPGAPAPFLDCVGAVAQLDGGPFSRFVQAGFQSLKRLAGPQGLVAADPGFGGVTSAFSHFQWALPLELQAIAPLAQTASPGDPVPVDPKVRVLTSHFHGSSPQVPVPGQAVTFEFFDVASASMGSSTVQSDSAGYASIPWVLTMTPGMHTVVASAFNTSSVVFEAEAVNPTVAWTAAGPTNFTLLEDGSTGDPSMSYNYYNGNGDPYGQHYWTLSTTAQVGGVATLPWTYDAMHSWFSVEIDVWAYVTDTNGTTETHLVDFFNQNFTGPQSFNGSVQLNVGAGDEYGFRFGGRHFDASQILSGTFTVVSPGFAPIIP
ncbi:MAG: hypothetical protein WEA09_15430 [Gemmatimonadota bacterium]